MSLVFPHDQMRPDTPPVPSGFLPMKKGIPETEINGRLVRKYM